MKKYLMLAVIVVLAFALAACGGTGDEPVAEDVNAEDAAGEEVAVEAEGPDLSGYDFSAPTVVIGADELDAFMDFRANTLAYDEGTIFQLSGLFIDTFGPGINMQTADGSYEGLGFTCPEWTEADYPEDYTPITITGVLILGQYSMDLYVPAANIVIGE